MADDLQPGDPVSWTEHGRWFSGRVVRRLTADIAIRGKRLRASPAAPRWMVETAMGARAAHPPEAVVRRRPDLADRGDVRQGELFAAPGPRPGSG